MQTSHGRNPVNTSHRPVRLLAGSVRTFSVAWLGSIFCLLVAIVAFAVSVFVVNSTVRRPVVRATDTYMPKGHALSLPGGSTAVVANIKQYSPFALNLSTAPPTVIKSDSKTLKAEPVGVSIIGVNGRLVSVAFGNDTKVFYTGFEVSGLALTRCQEYVGQANLGTPGITMEPGNYLCLAFKDEPGRLAFFEISRVSKGNVALELADWRYGP
jgi:hypothetical protein